MDLKDSSLRQYLNNNSKSINWMDKLWNLCGIAYGLKVIHDKGLIHHDFHCGNILSDSKYTYITDLGLCQPANIKSIQSNNKNIYGVLPYVAPEVLRGKEYTQASDIYGLGIIAYEVCTGYPPYHDIDHDETLAIRICNGQRPKFNYKIPQLILDIIKQCWNAVMVHFAEGYFAETHFTEAISPKGHFAEETFRRRDVSPNRHFAESPFPRRIFHRHPFRRNLFRRCHFTEWTFHQKC